MDRRNHRKSHGNMEANRGRRRKHQSQMHHMLGKNACKLKEGLDVLLMEEFKEEG